MGSSAAITCAWASLQDFLPQQEKQLKLEQKVPLSGHHIVSCLFRAVRPAGC